MSNGFRNVRLEIGLSKLSDNFDGKSQTNLNLSILFIKGSISGSFAVSNSIETRSPRNDYSFDIIRESPEIIRSHSEPFEVNINHFMNHFIILISRLANSVLFTIIQSVLNGICSYFDSQIEISY